MRVHELMTSDVKICTPDDTIRDAALAMRKIDAGVLPVGENDRMVGMITDRDIAMRAVAENRGPDTKVREAMSPEVLYCFDDQEAEEVAHQMSELQVRRLPVVNRDKRLIGMISLSDLSRGEISLGAHTLAGVSQRGGKHVQ